MKSTPVVNFINILRAPFVQISFHQKNTNPIYKHVKTMQNTLYKKIAHKMLVKWNPDHYKIFWPRLNKRKMIIFGSIFETFVVNNNL